MVILATFEPLEPGFALRAELAPLSALVIVASAADGEGAFVAGDEELPVGGEPDVVPANLADLPAGLL